MSGQGRREIGAIGEKIALAHLSAKGLRLIARNYRCKGGELDLVMLDGTTLALVEVRMRSESHFGSAAESVTPAKQRRLIVAAKHLLLTRRELARRRARFDVVALEPDVRGEMRVEWIKDAFRV